MICPSAVLRLLDKGGHSYNNYIFNLYLNNIVAFRSIHSILSLLYITCTIFKGHHSISMDTPDAGHKADSTGKRQERTGVEHSKGEESEVKQK